MIGYRKFFLATFASVCAVVLCWHHCLTGSEWVAAQSLILGLYKTADVLNRKNASPQS